MNKREIVRTAMLHRRPPYVPWQLGFTGEARQKLADHFGPSELSSALQNHLLELGESVSGGQDVGGGCIKDRFGVIWDRSVDHDIGIVKGCVLPEPSLDGYGFPDPVDAGTFGRIPGQIESAPDLFRVFSIGFSLYERAWTLRGMENLMMDMIENPGFVHELLGAITDWNLARIRRALEFDIDAVRFGDDWGQQTGLLMGPQLWREFLLPQLERMYGAVRAAGRMVMIHSCGRVQELFADLVRIGLNCFNPFQPEVMDVAALMREYRGRLAFYGGLSTQKTLPFGTPEDVRAEAALLLELGAGGGYIFSPAHAVEGDVPLENMLAFIGCLKAQPGFQAA